VSGPPEEVRKALINELVSGTDSRRRLSAAEQLGRLAPGDDREAGAKALVEILRDNDRSVVQAALVALRKWGDAGCAPAVIDVLRKNSNSLVRQDAMITLQEFPSEQAAEAIAVRLAELSDFQKALEVLKTMGPLAETPIAKALATANPLAQREICAMLKTIFQKQVPAEETVTALIEFTRTSKELLTMHEVIAILSKVKEKRVAEALAAGLNDVRYFNEVAPALIEIGPDSEPYVTPYLKHNNPNVRKVACNILGAVGTKKSITALQALSRDFFSGQEARAAIDAINQRAKQKN
jgi:HEAT repeat protein